MGHRRTLLPATGILALLFVTAGIFGAAAQEVGTPVVSDEAMAGRPVHIHVGSCPEVGEVVAPLNDLTSPTGTASAVGTPAGMMGARGISAEYSWTNVALPLDAILAGEHAINVHESEENMRTSIACGDIGGTVDQDGSLVIGLAEVEGSGFAGIAVLTSNAEDPATTDVSVFIAEGLVGETMGM